MNELFSICTFVNDVDLLARMATTQPATDSEASKRSSSGSGGKSEPNEGLAITSNPDPYAGNKTRIAFTWLGVLASGCTLTTESEFLAYSSVLIKGDFDYIVFQLERCPTTGRLHLQGAIRLSRGITYSAIHNRLR